MFVQEKLKELSSICRRDGIPLTVQRQAILEAVAGRTDHPTADQVFDQVKGSVPGVSRTTVYRVLEALVAMGLAMKVNNTQARARFDANTSRHDHLVCLGCGSVADSPFPSTPVHIPGGNLPGFEVLDISIVYSGFCSACGKTESASLNSPDI